MNHFKWYKFKSNGKWHYVPREPVIGTYDTLCGKVFRSRSRLMSEDLPEEGVCPYCLELLDG